MSIKGLSSYLYRDKIEVYWQKAHCRELKAEGVSIDYSYLLNPQSYVFNNLYSPTEGKMADDFEHITEYPVGI